MVSMSELLESLLKKENKKTCRVIGLFLTLLPLLFLFGGGFGKEVDGQGIILSPGWFREAFMVVIAMMMLMGIILMIVGFRKKEAAQA